MKKILQIGLITLLFITIYIVFNKENKIICTNKSINEKYSLESKYKVYYKKNEVYKIIIEEKIEAATTSILNEITNNVNQTYQKYKEEIGSYDYIINKNKNKATTKITINYDQINMEAYKKYNPNANLNENNKYNLEDLKKLYEERGITCK